VLDVATAVENQWFARRDEGYLNEARWLVVTSAWSAHVCFQ